MKKLKLILGIGFMVMTSSAMAQAQKDSELYTTIARMDSIYFNAYNTCDMEKQAEIFDEDIEFYHDKGGFSKDKQALLESLEKNICGKVTRTLVDGSIEVHPIENFGAVEIAMHKFYNKEEPNAKSKASKFIVIWKQIGDNWKISRVVSLH
ncbi:nuclear transport factor 2 family protein [Allomuricauda sp. CP2A]|jgi:ketosteroid isomerase-like protein|uniref:nuclear transport factor 2 family protein n=1 Tax=Allomuricauda sp. CP2A TaxID=1848189 RepID=UPI00082C429C|nr:nuclear transport factor 2 family protein [Muricauda sp. CP2A]